MTTINDKIYSSLLQVILILLCLSNIACEEKPLYGIEFNNRTGGPIYNCHVRIEDFTSIELDVSSGGTFFDCCYTIQNPKSVWVCWKDISGKEFEVEVDLENQIPKGFYGNIEIFVLPDNSVKLKVSHSQKRKQGRSNQ